MKKLPEEIADEIISLARLIKTPEKMLIGAQMCDSTAPEIVEVLIRADGKVVWVNVDGICRFRACRIKVLELNDMRGKEAK